MRPDRPSLDFRHKLNADGTKLIDRPYDETSTPKAPKSDKKDGGKKGTVLSLCTSCTDDVELDIFLIKAVLSYRDQEGITAITLLDPGARSNQDINLVDRQTLKHLVDRGAVTFPSYSMRRASLWSV